MILEMFIMVLIIFSSLLNRKNNAMVAMILVSPTVRGHMYLGSYIGSGTLKED